MTPDTNQTVLANALDGAILILAEEADRLSNCHTWADNDWTREEKARYDYILAVVDALEKLRRNNQKMQIMRHELAYERAKNERLIAILSAIHGLTLPPTFQVDGKPYAFTPPGAVDLLRHLSDRIRGIPHEIAAALAEWQQRAEDAERWRWATATDKNAEGLYTLVLRYGGDQQRINERADFYRDYPSSQKEKKDG